ncbi:hypothetical protein GYMLUDRAFT_319428 [Collybiopsis luxurians FD-317 M1]|nr:hypothetical protein GYMLUDRAFT_319428 [Collybiopsis luxurians FD-317 M1]
MTSVSSNIVFDDIFNINAIDKEGRKFDRVSRLYAHSKNYDMDLTLDYNIELFPLAVNQSFALALASSLARGPSTTNPDANEDEDKDRDVWRPDGKGRRGLEEDYDYVMYGKVNNKIHHLYFSTNCRSFHPFQVYKFDGGTSEFVTAYISFGGLLLSLTGSFRHMTNIVLGDSIYLLLRK